MEVYSFKFYFALWYYFFLNETIYRFHQNPQTNSKPLNVQLDFPRSVKGSTFPFLYHI